MILKAYIVPHPPLIVPEVGRGEEKTIQDTVDNYKKFAKEIVDFKPDTIIISSPHSTSYADYFHISPGTQAYGDFSNFGVPQVNVTANYDTELVEALDEAFKARGLPAGTMGAGDNRLDHATLIPLYFLQQEDPNFLKDTKIVRIGLSGLPLAYNYEVGKTIEQVADELGKKVVFIASGDLSHVLKADGPYGYQKEGPQFDKLVTDIIEGGELSDFVRIDRNFARQASECGLGSFAILSGALDNYDYETVLDSYEGPFGVGYACAEVDVKGENK